MTKTCDAALGAKCFSILIREVGPVDAERFIAYVNRERMDYTEWQQNLFAGQTIDEIAALSRAAGAQMRTACSKGRKLGSVSRPVASARRDMV